MNFSDGFLRRCNTTQTTISTDIFCCKCFFFKYCTISVNSAENVRRYTPAEMTVTIHFFSTVLESILWFFGFFGVFAHKDSAHPSRLIDRYIGYISAISEGPLRVTAELTEMVSRTNMFFIYLLFRQRYNYSIRRNNNG